MVKSEEIIVNIFKKASEGFAKNLDERLSYYFDEKIAEDEILLIFELIFDRHLKYLLAMKKQRTNSEKIPEVIGYERLDMVSNPYKILKYTDENYILGNIYDFLVKFPIKEMACYPKIGILLKDPLELKGIYNINVKYIGD